MIEASDGKTSPHLQTPTSNLLIINQPGEVTHKSHVAISHFNRPRINSQKEVLTHSSYLLQSHVENKPVSIQLNEVQLDPSLPRLKIPVVVYSLVRLYVHILPGHSRGRNECM